MTKESGTPKDRRVDTRERLRYAIRKAHDRMFAILRPQDDQEKAQAAAEQGPPRTPPPKR